MAERTTERKRRSDAWENAQAVSDADQDRVLTWARRLGYQKALALIEAELKITPPSMGAFAEWFAWRSKLDSEDRTHRAVINSAAVRELAESTGDVSTAMAKALEAESCAAILDGGDPDRTKLLVGLALKARQGLRSERTLEMELTKFRDTMTGAIERGLAALAEEAKANPEALRHYQAFRSSILASVASVESTRSTESKS